MSESPSHRLSRIRSSIENEFTDNASADSIEADLSELQSLLKTTVAKHRRWVARNSLITTVTREKITDAVHHMMSGAEESVDSTVTDIDYACAVKAAYLAQGPRRHNIRLRLLTDQTVLRTGLIHPTLLERPETELRVTRVPRLQMLIVDGRSSMVTTAGSAGRQTSVVQATSFVRTLNQLFEGLWAQAVSVKDRIDLVECGQLLAPTEVLERLRAGETDEVAARELAVSVRTYRRYVAEIMKLLGTYSRFQTGVRAAELGLMSEISPPRTETLGSDYP